MQHSSCDAANAEKRAFAGLARCTYGVWPCSPSETLVAGAIKSPRMRGGCESPVRCRQCLRLGMLLGPGGTWSYDQKWKEGAALCAKLLCKPALKPGKNIHTHTPTHTSSMHLSNFLALAKILLAMHPKTNSMHLSSFLAFVKIK